VTQLALALVSIAIAATSAGATNGPVAKTQSDQDRQDYEAYEAALREVNEEADRVSRTQGYGEESVRPSRPATQTAIRPIVSLGSALPTSGPLPTGATPGSPSSAAASAPASAPVTRTVALATTRASSASATSGDVPAGCSLFLPGYASVPTEKCMQCHALSRTHPVDLDYAATIQKNPKFMYRPVEEVVRRGVFLPNGQIACVTCHDANSPWQDRIALPAGSQARAAVDPRNHETYAGNQVQSASTLPPHSAVTPTPLCQACHTYGD